MTRPAFKKSSTAVSAIFNVLDPIPVGFFVGALVFDAMYADSAQVMWFKAAAWLISIGLVIAVVPRVINLVRVWFPRPWPDGGGSKAAFFLYLMGVIAAIVNAFVHSRDAYAVIPTGLWLSALSALLIAIAQVLEGSWRDNTESRGHA